MIGHSMGAIVVNELLESFPHLPYQNVVYMGGAASIRDTQRAIKPVLLAAPGCTHFFNLSLHPMNEAREFQSAGFAVSGSLLVWVDEMFERPKTLLDRTIGHWRNVRMVKRVFPPELQSQMLFRVFDRDAGDPPRRDNPLDHGGFNNPGVRFWRSSFWGGPGAVPGAPKLPRRNARYNPAGRRTLMPSLLGQLSPIGRSSGGQSLRGSSIGMSRHARTSSAGGSSVTTPPTPDVVAAERLSHRRLDLFAPERPIRFPIARDVLKLAGPLPALPQSCPAASSMGRKTSSTSLPLSCSDAAMASLTAWSSSA